MKNLSKIVSTALVFMISLTTLNNFNFSASEVEGSIVEASSVEAVEGYVSIEEMYPELNLARSVTAKDIMREIDEDNTIVTDQTTYTVDYELTENNELVVSYESNISLDESGSIKQTRASSTYYASVSTGVTVYSLTGNVLGTGLRTFSFPITKTTSSGHTTYKISSSYATTVSYYGLTPVSHRALITNRTTAGLKSYARVESVWKRGINTYLGRNVLNAPVNT